MKTSRLKLTPASLLFIALIFSILLETEGRKKKKSKEDKGDDDEGGGGNDDEDAAGTKMKKDFEDMVESWKNFKMPMDTYGVPTFMDMQKCLSQAMKKGMKDHPDIGLDLAEVIEAHGYPVEEHKVQTSDGYKLKLFRIPYSDKSPVTTGKKKMAVYLNHGLGGNGHEWVLQWNERSLGYLLAESGYDVWLSNTRGSRYGRKHVDKTSKDENFWDFSFDELGRYEVPAVINTVLNVTGQSDLFYVGHGLGTTAFVVALSEIPELNKKIKHAILLGPILFIGHSKSFLKTLAPLAKKGQYKKNPIFGGKGQSAQEQFNQFGMRETYNKACKPAVLHCFGCSNLYFTIGGFNGEQTNYTMLPLISSLFPDKISTKTLVHYAQIMLTGKFGRFDYGSEEDNNQVYEVETPPEYDLSKLTAPMSIFYANGDHISPPEDVEFTKTKLPTVKDLVKVDSEGFTHGDFVTAIHAKSLVYEQVLKIMESAEGL